MTKLEGHIRLDSLRWPKMYRARILNCLHNEEIDIVGQAWLKTDHQLMHVPNLGKKSVRILRETIGYAPLRKLKPLPTEVEGLEARIEKLEVKLEKLAAGLAEFIDSTQAVLADMMTGQWEDPTPGANPADVVTIETDAGGPGPRRPGVR